MTTIAATITPVKWKLPELLAREGVTAYRLHKELGEMGVRAAPNTVYRWAKELPAYVTVEHLEGVISALRRLTGKHITVCDLMEVEDA